MANTIIKYCQNCAQTKTEHSFQDKMYGTYKRVFNINEDTGACTCTVCKSKSKIVK